jgi:hypothetical protein
VIISKPPAPAGRQSRRDFAERGLASVGQLGGVVGQEALTHLLHVILVGDLLHKTDDPAPQHSVLDPHECFGEANSIRHGEEVGHIVQ